VRLAAIVWITACGGEPDLPGSGEAPVANEARPAPSRRLVEVRAPRDASLLEAPAIVRADPSATGEVASTFRARVGRVHVRLGQTVKAGDPVVDVIVPEVLEAAATRVAVDRRLEVHRERAAELERLRAEGLVKSSRVFEQRTTIAALEAEHARAVATLRAADVDPAIAGRLLRRGALTLRSPVAGVVVVLDARPGEIREGEAAPLAVVRGVGAIRVEVRTSEPWPGGGAALVFRVAGEPELPLAPEPLVSMLDPETGTRLHWFVPDVPRPLPDGLRGSVRLVAGREVWQVPNGAVVQDGEGAHVVRVTRSNGELDDERVAVVVVAASGANALVRGALREGDHVAVEPRP
jgi:membrane fusion protein, heavy metal efflux system